MKISVALCSYNGERYIREQLNSIAAQTRLPDELVICDDRSTDATTKIISEFSDSAPFPVRVYLNEKNLGSTKNFERAIGLCEGDIIALSDQDDVWLPVKLRVIEERLASAEIGLVFSDATAVDEQLRPLGFTLWQKLGLDEKRQEQIRSGRALDILLPGWTVTGATMAFRAQYRSIAFEIPSNIPMIHDGWIALTVASVSGIDVIAEPLIKYRQHPGQQIGAPQKEPDKPVAAKNLHDVRTALRRETSYAELIAIAELLRQRLQDRCDATQCSTALTRLDARLVHMKTRFTLPRRRLSRVTPVMREFFSGRYGRYSNGAYSALKDLLREGDAAA